MAHEFMKIKKSMCNKAANEFKDKLESLRKNQADEYTLQTYLQEAAAKQEALESKIDYISKKILNDPKTHYETCKLLITIRMGCLPQKPQATQAV